MIKIKAKAVRYFFKKQAYFYKNSHNFIKEKRRKTYVLKNKTTYILLSNKTLLFLSKSEVFGLKKSHMYVASLLVIALLLLPTAVEIQSMAQVTQNLKYPTISLPTIMKNAIQQYGELKIQEVHDIYHVTPLLTGVDININLNGSHLLQYGIANKTTPPDENFTASVENFLSNLNESSTLSIIVTVGSFNEPMMLYSAYRNFLDIALEWAETTSDALIIVANDKATPANLMKLLELAQQNPNVTEINMVILTHGILTNETHGMLLWGQEEPKIVEPELLYQHYTKISKLNFVFLPFCSVEDEYKIYNDNSIKGFFLNIGADEVIGGYGELSLNVEYLSWVQDILMGGIWTDEYGYFEIPVYDNKSNEWFTLVMEYNFTIAEEELPVIQGNETSLGITIGSGGGRTYRTISKKTSVSVSVKKGLSKTTVKKTRTSKVGTRNWKHISGRAKLSMIEGYLIDPGSGNSHKKKSSSSSISSKINSYKSKIEKAKRSALSSFVVADRIISKIYGGYVAAKSKLKRTIYKYFSWIGKFPASLIWSVMVCRVLKGVDWLLSKISRDGKFKSLISVAYNMLKAGKSSWELALALIGWGVTKFASSILKYFGNFTSWILSKFGSVGSWLKKLIKGWVDPAMSFVNNKLAYFEKKLKNSLSTIAQSVGLLIELLASYIINSAAKVVKSMVQTVEKGISSRNFVDILSIIGYIMKIGAAITSILSKVNDILNTINIVQTIIEVSTAGIGAVITRILLPLIAAYLINQAIPHIFKTIYGLPSVTFEMAPITINDVIAIITGGISGFIEFVMSRVFPIMMLTAYVQYAMQSYPELATVLNNILKIAANPVVILNTIAEYLIINDLRNTLNSLVGSQLSEKIINEFLSELHVAVNGESRSEPLTVKIANILNFENSGIDRSKRFLVLYLTNTALTQLRAITAFNIFSLLFAVVLKKTEDISIKGFFRNWKTWILVIFPIFLGTVYQWLSFVNAYKLSGIRSISEVPAKQLWFVLKKATAYTINGLVLSFLGDTILETVKFAESVSKTKRIAEKYEDAYKNGGFKNDNEVINYICENVVEIYRTVASYQTAGNAVLAAVSMLTTLLKLYLMTSGSVKSSDVDSAVMDRISKVLLGGIPLDIAAGVSGLTYAVFSALTKIKYVDVKVSEFSEKVKSFAEKLLSTLKEMMKKKETIKEIKIEIEKESRKYVKENFINFAAWKKLAIVKIIGMTTAVISDLNKFNIANIKLGDNAVFYLKLSVFAISIWETWLDLIVDDYKISIQDTATFFFMASTLTHLSVLFLAIYSPANLDNAVNATLNIIEK